MKKVIRLTEQQLANIVKKVVDSQKNQINYNKPTNFKAEAIVEDDMLMEFPVVKLNVSGSNVKMFFNDVSLGSGKRLLYVNNFEGPIYDASTNKIAYRDSFFQNIGKQNYKQISKSQNIPV